MRIRTIKPEYWPDARSGEWGAPLALFYIGIWQVADDAGRLRLDPRLIRAELDPFDTKFGGIHGVADLLEQLVRQGRIRPYVVDGQRFGLVTRFAAHQKIDRPTKSRLPEPPEVPPGGLDESSPNPPRALARNHVVDQGRDQGSGIEGSREQGPGKGLAGLPAHAREAEPTQAAPRPAKPEAAAARASAAPAPDDPPPRTLVVVNAAEHPLCHEFAARMKQGIGHGLVVAAKGEEARVADDLETLLVERGEGAVEDVARFVLGTARRRNVTPGSLTWCLAVARDMPPPEAPREPSPPSRWEALVEAMSPAQLADFEAERKRLQAEVVEQRLWTSEENRLLAEAEEFLWAKWSGRLMRSAGGA